MRLKTFLIVAPLVLALGACESTKDWDWFGISSGDAANTVKVTAPAGCPPLEVPKPAAELALGGTAPLDLRALVQFAASSGTCEQTANGTRQAVHVNINATKGPALKGSTVDVPFFVAVVGPDNNVLAKKMYQTTFDFSDELAAAEELTVTLTLDAVQAQTASIVAGLGIDPDSLPATR